MAGSKLVRFLLIRNNPSCKTPEADYPRAFLPALEALTSCLASEEDYPRDFLKALEALTSSGFRRRLPDGFPSDLGSLTSSHTSEEYYPRAFLQASEVSHPPKLSKKSTQGLSFKPWLFSHPPKLPKKSTRGLSFKPRVFSPPPILPKKTTRWPSSRPWKLSHPAWFSKKTTRGSDYSSSGGSRVLMMAFSNSAIPTAPRCIKGLPSIGMKRREGIERIPNRAASSFSSSTLTL